MQLKEAPKEEKNVARIVDPSLCTLPNCGCIWGKMQSFSMSIKTYIVFSGIYNAHLDRY